MELGSDLNEAKASNETPKEAPKRKRGRPKKGSNVKDGLDQAKLDHLKKDTDQSFLFTDQNQIKFLMYGDMITRPKKRGRPRKSKVGCPKKNNEPDLDQLCPAKASLEEKEMASDIITAKVDSVHPSSTSEDGASKNELEPTKTFFNEELINTSYEEEPTNSSNGNENVSDICPSTRVLRCSVRLKRLEKNEMQQHLYCSTDDETPVDKTLKKDPLLENLGKFLRYKGSSTRGNFLKTYDYGESANPWCLKFSDDSCDEDYLPEKEVSNKKKNNDDSDWIPSEKSIKRKSGKNIPVNNNVKSLKSNEKENASTKLNYPFIDHSGTSVDNSFPSKSFYSPHFSGELSLLTTPNQNVDSTQTSGCVSTYLIRNSDKNHSSAKHSLSMMSESKVIQSSTASVLKRKHSELQVSRTSTYPSKETIEVIDLCSDSSPEDESTKPLSSDCPIKEEPNSPALNACKSLTISKVPRESTKCRVLQNSSCASSDYERVVNRSAGNREELALEKHQHYLMSEINSSRWKRRKNFEQLVPQRTGDSSLQTVQMGKNSQLMTESIGTDVNVQIKHSKYEVPSISYSNANTLPTDISKEHSYSQMKSDSKRTNLNAQKCQSIRKIQNTLQCILNQNIRLKRKVSQACGVTSNPSIEDSVSSDLQTVLQRQDSQLLTEVPVGKSSNVSQDEIIQTNNCVFNEAAKIDNALENSSHNSKLMPGLFVVEPLSKTKVGQPKQATEMAGCPVKHQELNGDVSFKGLGLLNSSVGKSEQNVEQSHVFDVSHIVHCNKISGNLNDENTSAEHCCAYCKSFAELDAITILAAADFGDNPKAYIECEIESNEAMYEKLKVGQPQDGEVELKMVEHKNRFLKYGRDYLSNFGSFIGITEHLLK